MTSRRPIKPYRTRAEDLVGEAFTSAWTPTEDEFTELFLAVLVRTGWTLRAHVHDSRHMDLRSSPGLPDWFAVNPAQHRTAWFELKGFGGSATPAQRGFIRAINDAGGEAYLVGTCGDYAADAAALAELLGPGGRPR